jgi:polar amino acid transport system substrate-binding protein
MAMGKIAALTTVLAMLGSPVIAGETLDRVTSAGKLVMSSDPEYPPQSFLNDANEMDGFDIDVGKAIAEKMGVELEIVTPSWEVITAGSWAGRWDMSVGSMTPTAARAEVLDFPAIYYYTPAAFAVHTDSDVQSIDELNDKIIGSCGGCTYDAYLNRELVIDAEGVPEFEYQVTAAEIRTYETDTNAFDDLRLGDGVRVDAVFSALPTIQAAIDAGYPMRIVGDPAFYEPLSVATDKGDEEFNARIAEIVEELHADGTLSELSEKWYKVDLTTVE